MGKKKKKSSESSENENGGEEDPNKVVLKVERHCEGCASRILKIVRGFQGVESVKPEWEEKRVIVFGKMDPVKIRDKLADKTKKKVDLVSPLPNKPDKKKQPQEEQNKPKQSPAATTEVLKLSLHCQGCIDKIHKILVKTDGIHEKCVDREKEVVTVKGTMDVKSLVESLKKSMKRPVEIVQPKKEKKGDKNGAEEDKNKKMDEKGHGYGYGYGQTEGEYEYENLCPFLYPEMFSEENANACTVM